MARLLLRNSADHVRSSSRAIFDLGDVADPNRNSASRADDDLTELIGGGDAAQSAEAQFLRAGDHAAARRFDVFALQRFAHIEDGEIVRSELLRVEQHADLPLLPAVQVNAADSIHGLNGAPHLLVGNLGQLAAAHRSR